MATSLLRALLTAIGPLSLPPLADILLLHRSASPDLATLRPPPIPVIPRPLPLPFPFLFPPPLHLPLRLPPLSLGSPPAPPCQLICSPPKIITFSPLPNRSASLTLKSLTCRNLLRAIQYFPSPFRAALWKKIPAADLYPPIGRFYGSFVVS